MNVLILGGTRALSAATSSNVSVRSGHRVVCFHRGQTTWTLAAEVEERFGDRNEDLGAVSSERWDAIVDTSCYRPEQIRRSLELRTDRYLLISTVSAYRDLAARGISEEAPTIETFDPSDEAASYGGNKAVCERLLIERHPGRQLILRPGLIAGRWDGTGRVSYGWERRFRGGRVFSARYGEPSRSIHRRCRFGGAFRGARPCNAARGHFQRRWARSSDDIMGAVTRCMCARRGRARRAARNDRLGRGSLLGGARGRAVAGYAALVGRFAICGPSRDR